jgi:hypothetical protein
MDPNIRKNLKTKMLNAAGNSEFKGMMGNLFIDSFVRQMSTTLQVSAIDEAHAISALLEFPHHINQFNDQTARETDQQYSK